MQNELFTQPTDAIGDVERWCIAQGYDLIVGIDEAGRGPLAGPVYAAAVVLDLEALEEAWISTLDDSKKLTDERREEAFELICTNARAWGIARADNEEIDRINILQATFRAMERALEEVTSTLGDRRPDYVLIDGNRPIVTELPQRSIVKGDARSLHIAAASILAKVARDRAMTAYHEQWPEYGFAGHKGYPTAAHRAAIAAHGPCAIHRLTFAGVREHAHRLRR